MKTILLVIDCLRPGGAQRQIVNLANGLSDQGYLVDLYIYFPGYNHYIKDLRKNVSVINGSKRFRFSVIPILDLRKLMRKIMYTGVIAFLDTPSFYAEIAHLGIRTFPLIISERSTFLKTNISVGKWILYQHHRLADIISVNSYHQQQKMIAFFPWMERKIKTIYNGVDLSEFIPENKLPCEQELKIYRFIVLSTVVPKKNALNLAKALTKVSKTSDIPVVIDWAGEHSHTIESAEEVKKVNDLLTENNLIYQWHWLGIKDGVNRLLNNYDALVHPSLSEGLPNSICEALASGLPVLAGRIGDHEYIVNSSKAGCLFDPENPEDIAKSILMFISLSDCEKNRIRKGAREFAEKELTLEKMTGNYISLFGN